MSSKPDARGALPRRAPRMPVEERRTQLLQCAIRVFARDGIASAGHADVAMEAEVSVPTVFAYFPTRQELVRAVVREVDQFIMDRARRAAEAGNTASEKLVSVLRDFAEEFETHPDYLKIWLCWGTSIQDEVWPLYLDFINRVIVFHREIIDAGRRRGELADNVDPEMSAYLVLGAAAVIIQMKVAQRDPHSIARYLEATIHGALHQG